jgi:hypothetical protein
VTIIDAINDPNLFRPFLGDDLTTWEPWFGALAALYGLPVPKELRPIVRQCTGRKCLMLPDAGFTKALFLVGRRSGKSRIAAIVAAFEAALSGREKLLAKGETGIVAVVSPTRAQSRIVHNYVRSIFAVPLLQGEVVAETATGFELRNGVRIEILTGDHRSIRGFTLLACVIDEACFFAYSEESKIKSDTELVRAVTPGLATTGGRLIAISSPYARKGWSFRTFEKCFGNDNATTLVWNAASRTMNSTLPQQVVDDAMAEDLQAAKSEYLGEFRDDVAEFLPRSLIESLVVKGRQELVPRTELQYFAFADLSGGRLDDAALAIAHRADRKVVIDLLRRYRPPFSPQEVIGQMTAELRKYNLRRVTGDNYAAEFVASGFRGQGINYTKSEKVKSLLYLELLPRLCSGEVELLDNEKLVNQLAGLERRTRSGGRDVIDHASNGHDDLANVVAGVADLAGKRRMMVGGLGAFGGNGVGVGDPTIARRALAAAVSANSSSNRSFV